VISFEVNDVIDLINCEDANWWEVSDIVVAMATLLPLKMFLHRSGASYYLLFVLRVVSMAITASSRRLTLKSHDR
jgi:hypothetical protein